MKYFKIGKWAVCVVLLYGCTLLAVGKGKTIVKHTLVGTSVKGKGKTSADGYSRIATYGKSWIVENGDGRVQRYYLSGDTVIGSWTGLKLYLDSLDTPSYQGTLCESGFQSGIIVPGEQEPWLMYHFGLELNDEECIYNPLYDDSRCVHVMGGKGWEDVLMIFGQYNRLNPDSLDGSSTWIEGIGSIYGILSPCVIGSYTPTLRACYEADRCLYKDGRVCKETDSIGFLKCKTVSDIATFKQLMNGTESTLVLKNDTVCSVVGDSILLTGTSGTLILYRTGLSLRAGDCISGTITGRKEWVDGKPVLMATANTSADNYSVMMNILIGDVVSSIGRIPAPAPRWGRGTSLRLDGIRSNRQGIVIRNGRKYISR